MSMKLQFLVGSACYGLSVETSDTDVYLVGNGDYIMSECKKPHVIHDSSDIFIRKSLLEYQKHPLFLQALFPAKSLINTDASRFIEETREMAIRSNLKSVYDTHISIGSGLLYLMEEFTLRAPKRVAYGILFLDTIYRYAEGATFAEAIRPEEDLCQILLDIRRKKLDPAEVTALGKDKIELAKSVHKFYENSNDESDRLYLTNWRKEMLEILRED